MGQLLVVTHVHKGPLDQVVGSSRHQQGENGGTVTEVANVEHIYDLAGQRVIEIKRIGKMRRHSYEARAADGPGFRSPIDSLQQHCSDDHWLNRPDEQGGRFVAQGGDYHPCQDQRRKDTQPLPAEHRTARQASALVFHQDRQQAADKKRIHPHVEGLVDVVPADMENQVQDGTIRPLPEYGKYHHADQCTTLLQQKQKEQRPQQIELFFDCERPTDPHMQMWLNLLRSKGSPVVHEIEERDDCRLPIKLVRKTLNHSGENPATIKRGEDPVSSPTIEVC